MPTSFNRRLALSLTAPTKVAVIVAAIALALFIAAKDSSPVSATFTPTYPVSLCTNLSAPPSTPAADCAPAYNTTSNAAADLRTVLTIPGGDYNFSQIITTRPGAAFMAPGPGNPGYNGATHPILGDIAGTLFSQTSLGLNNGACNTLLPVPFTFLWSTVDNSAGNEIPSIPQASTGTLGTLENMQTDDGAAPGAAAPYNTTVYPGYTSPAPVNGIPASVERYPAYLNDLFNNVQPLNRIRGNTVVANTMVGLDYVTFDPGDLKAAFAAPHPFNDLDASMGYITVVVLNDTTVPGAPSSITDFCSSLVSTTTIYGTTETNTCNGVTAAPCNSANGITAPASGGNDTGRQAYGNPANQTGTQYLFIQSLRDLDGDGLENAFDTCPQTANTDGDPRVTNGPDGDILDSACDPTPGTNTGGGNHDGDTAAGRAWNNGQDNCPIVVNGAQTDTDGLILTADNIKAPRGGPAADSMGDACDPNPSRADGMFTTILREAAFCFGGTDADNDGWCTVSGNSLPNDPNDGDAAETPETWSRFVKLPIAHSGSGTNANVIGTVSVGLGLQANGDASNTGSFSNAGMGQPYQACNDGIDNDGDGLSDLLDPGCKPPNGIATTGTDSDGDGWADLAELYIGTDALGRCEVGAHGAGISDNYPSSTDWPGDLISNSIPASTDKETIGDLSSFVAPTRRLGTQPGDANFDQRWDLIPGSAIPGAWINVLDLSAFVSGTTGFPPMNGGARVYNSLVCTAHPTLGD